jgi:hypothetical protein
MRIQIEPHALQRAIERGVSEMEINETIEKGVDIQAKSGRSGKTKTFPFGQFRNGRRYEEKKLEVFYVVENELIVIITVYAYYGKF